MPGCVRVACEACEPAGSSTDRSRHVRTRIYSAEEGERGRFGAAAFPVGTTLPSMPASASALAVGAGAPVSSEGLRAIQSERRQTHPTWLGLGLRVRARGRVS